MATPEKTIHGIPVRAVPDRDLPRGVRACVACALFSYTDCTVKVQTDAGFENCVQGEHHYEVVQ